MLERRDASLGKKEKLCSCVKRDLREIDKVTGK